MSGAAETIKLARAAELGPLEERRRRSGAWRRFRRHRLAMIGVVILALLTGAAVAAPVITGQDPNRASIKLYRKPPSMAHILGS
ncbi:MAG TPA: hypothetical protein VKB09_09060, partial [Thermomicrobiales bacterium]|nr:hypothetical protein [Thermomicrobiales bacterium]